MTEPVGRTIDDQPWEEARPPHLPDRLTSITPWVLPFLLVAAYQVWGLWVDQPRDVDLATRLGYWVGARFQFAGIAASLLGAALFLRHPDARTTLPRLASGVSLVLLGQVMTLGASTLGPVFFALTPPSDDLFFFSPADQAYGLLTSVVGYAGIAVIASGLSTVRRHEEAGPGRRLEIGLVLLAVLSTASYALGFAWPGENTVSLPAWIIVGAVVVHLLGTLAWAYLVVIALRGWRGRAAPRVGWGLAALGAALAVLKVAVAPIAWAVPASSGLVTAETEPVVQELIIRLFELLATAGLVGWVLLVAAFAVGLPSSASEPDEPDASPTLDPPAVTQPGSATG